MTETSDSLVPTLSDADFLAAIENLTLTKAQFDHGEHVRAGYLFSVGVDFATAAARMERAIRSLSVSFGRPDRYNETITFAYLALIRCRMIEAGPFADWASFAEANPDLLEPTLLDRYYSSDELGTELARQTFVLPAARLI